MSQPVEHIEVFAGPTLEADLVRLHLQEHGIDARLEEENVGTWFPFAADSGGAGAVKVTVPLADEVEARELIARKRGQA
jgi:hypothetical protein